MLSELLAGLAEAGEQCSIPFLAHADFQPAVCLLFVLQVLPALKEAPDQAVLRALHARTKTEDVAARQSTLAQLFSTTLELLQVCQGSIFLWPPWKASTSPVACAPSWRMHGP